MLQTEHFDVYYYPEEAEAVRLAGRMAERWYVRLSRLLEFTFADRQPLILYACHPHFRQTNAVGGEIGEGTGGVTESFKRRVVLPFAGPLAETDHVLGHELVHAFQTAITGQGRGGVPGAARLPLWFIEGMAEYLSLGPMDPHTAMWMRDAVQRDKLPTVSDLGNPRYFPYRYGHALWAYIGGRWGDESVGRILKAAGARSSTAETAIEKVLGIKPDELSKDWHAALRKAYGGRTGKAAEIARPLITKTGTGGELNVGPAVSPDGSDIIFLSEKSLFSIELFLADARSGRVRERLSETAVDPHFDSLQFINSSGAWDRSGRRFVFAAISEGRPVLSVLDVRRGRFEQEIRIESVDEAFTPTWSPDGRKIAFSGLSGGLLDLYAYDLPSGKLRRLTEDPYAEVQPAWSPDGKAIAFATDRFSSRLSDLDLGNYRLALADPEGGGIRELPSFPHAKNINPQWSPDSASLYFLSDRDGATNLYRLELASGRLVQLTELATGISGITALSPALSVSSAAGRVTFSVYENERYNIYALDAPEKGAGRPLQADHGVVRSGVLPPREQPSGEVAALKENADRGLPDGRGFRITDYRPRLSLDFVGQPYLAVGADRFGTYLGGGAALFFSDMLGDHNLAAALQSNGGLRDIAAVVGYTNLERRWNWGVTVEQVPYRTGGFAQSTDVLDGEPVVVEETLLFRQTSRGLSGVAAYPFSRARRVEFSAGYRHVSFDQEIETLVFSLDTGRLLLDERQDLPAGNSLHLAEATAALVHDTAVFGATGPIFGARYRLEFSPVAGSLRFSSVLADYRRYVMPVRPFTLAARVLHFGRYGRDGEDERLFPLYLGFPNLVRGYDTGSFSIAECGDVEAGCPVFDQLFGSRLIVASGELRFPLLGLFGGESYYGPFPIEGVAFYDTGVAWVSGERPDFLGGERARVASYGFGGRINFFGFAILELDYVRPLDRPLKGWHWQFRISPGF